MFRTWAGRYSQSWNLQRPTKTRTYCPGGYVLAPDDRIADEQARGPIPPVALNIGIWVERFEEIDIFDWQSEVEDMLSTGDLELALASSEGYLPNRVLKGELMP